MELALRPSIPAPREQRQPKRETRSGSRLRGARDSCGASLFVQDCSTRRSVLRRHLAPLLDRATAWPKSHRQHRRSSTGPGRRHSLRTRGRTLAAARSISRRRSCLTWRSRSGCTSCWGSPTRWPSSSLCPRQASCCARSSSSTTARTARSCRPSAETHGWAPPSASSSSRRSCGGVTTTPSITPRPATSIGAALEIFRQSRSPNMAPYRRVGAWPTGSSATRQSCSASGRWWR